MESRLPTPEHSFESKDLAYKQEVHSKGAEINSSEEFSDSDRREAVSNIPNVNATVQLPKVPVSQGDGNDEEENNKKKMSRIAKAGSESDDNGLIEKDWVDKAKKVVADTRMDPYLQEREINKLQANYLKERYGKDIKVEK